MCANVWIPFVILLRDWEAVFTFILLPLSLMSLAFWAAAISCHLVCTPGDFLAFETAKVDVSMQNKVCTWEHEKSTRTSLESETWSRRNLDCGWHFLLFLHSEWKKKTKSYGWLNVMQINSSTLWLAFSLSASCILSIHASTWGCLAKVSTGQMSFV